MIKRIGRRFVSLLLTFVTVLTLLPAMTLPALAATNGTVTGLADENIGLSFTGNADNAWSASGLQIVGSATGKASEAIARQPEASGKINSALLLGCALAEGTAIFGFITALLIIFMG